MNELRVLVAEDNEDHRFFIERTLRQLDDVVIDVESVRDGAEALDFLYRRGDYADRSRPHLILLDLKMPKVDGLEVIAQVKGDPDLSTIPIAVLTSSDRREDIDASYRGGGNAYVVKRGGVAGLREGLRALGEFWTGVATLPIPPA